MKKGNNMIKQEHCWVANNFKYILQPNPDTILLLFLLFIPLLGVNMIYLKIQHRCDRMLINGKLGFWQQNWVPD